MIVDHTINFRLSPESIETNIKTNPNREKLRGRGHELIISSNAINNSFEVLNADDFYGANFAYQRVI